MRSFGADCSISDGAEWHALSGWGESTHRLARVVRPTSVEELGSVVEAASRDGAQLTLRGAGRSYGDAALPAERRIIDLRALRAMSSLDPEAGTITVAPGVTIEDLWRAVVPQGWWPPVVPGTMRPTVGGCVAMNVHGKNQYAVGPIGEHIEAFELLLADGSRRVVHHDRDADLFRAVVGGAGLLGIVTSVTLRMRRVACGLLDVTARACSSLAEVAADLEARRATSDYLVAWIDAFDVAGRGVVHAATHVTDAAAGALDLAAQDLPDRLFGIMPRTRVATLIGLCSGPHRMRAINALKFRSAALRGEHSFRQAHAAFHFLLDYVPGWKAIYGAGGMFQHQSFVPLAASVETHSALLALCRKSGLVPWLSVYKRHRPDAFLLSHNVDGFSLALDFRVTSENREQLLRLCHELDAIVVAAGGRFYFAKDATAEPATLCAAYPGLARFREWKHDLDPGGVFTSALAERLGIFRA